MEVGVAFAVLEVASLGKSASFIPDARDCPPGDVPEFAGGESERVQSTRRLALVDDASTDSSPRIGGLNRHTAPVVSGLLNLSKAE